jgi:hypothetical protein
MWWHAVNSEFKMELCGHALEAFFIYRVRVRGQYIALEKA